MDGFFKSDFQMLHVYNARWFVGDLYDPSVKRSVAAINVGNRDFPFAFHDAQRC